MKRHLLRFIAVLMAIITIAGCIPVGREVRTIAAEKKAVTVKSVEALIKAMKDPNVVTIKFKSSKEISITIPSNKKAKNKKLSISASNAAVVNDAKFKSITLKSIGSYEENANGNSVTVKDYDAKIRIAEASKLDKLVLYGKTADITAEDKADIKSLVCRKTSASVNIDAGKGTKIAVTLSRKTNLTLCGDASADINVSSKAKGSSVTAYIPVDLSAFKNTNLRLEAGSEGSSVDIASESVKAKVTNNTDTEPVRTVAGAEVPAPAPVTEEVEAAETGETETPGTESEDESASGAAVTPAPSNEVIPVPVITSAPVVTSVPDPVPVNDPSDSFDTEDYEDADDETDNDENGNGTGSSGSADTGTSYPVIRSTEGCGAFTLDGELLMSWDDMVARKVITLEDEGWDDYDELEGAEVIVVPNTVESIYYSFVYCNYLKKLVLPETINYISHVAFYRTVYYTDFTRVHEIALSVEFPNGISPELEAGIGRGDCRLESGPVEKTGDKNVYVTPLWKKEFENTEGCGAFTADGELVMTWYDMVMQDVIELDKSLLGVGDMLVEDGTVIRDYYEIEDAEVIVVPNYIVMLEGAFQDCEYLKKIVLPESVKVVYYDAFEGSECRVEFNNGISDQLLQEINKWSTRIVPVSATTTPGGGTIYDTDGVLVQEAMDMMNIQPDDSRYEIVRKVHDWMAFNISYDTIWYFQIYNKNPGYMIDVRDASSDHPGNIGWILVYKKAICQGYTLLFNAFMNELGIESLHLSSDSMNHAWNLVHMDDDHWYHIDVTWDAPSELDDVKYYSTYDFLRSDEGITEQGHRNWRALPYYLDTPAADGTYYEENVDHNVCKPVPVN